LLDEVSSAVASNIRKSHPHNFGAGVLAQESTVCADGLANHRANFVVVRFVWRCGQRLRTFRGELPKHFVARQADILEVTLPRGFEMSSRQTDMLSRQPPTPIFRPRQSNVEICTARGSPGI
jgi:hypothetical protein